MQTVRLELSIPGHVPLTAVYRAARELGCTLRLLDDGTLKGEPIATGTVVHFHGRRIGRSRLPEPPRVA